MATPSAPLPASRLPRVRLPGLRALRLDLPGRDALESVRAEIHPRAGVYLPDDTPVDNRDG